MAQTRRRRRRRRRRRARAFFCIPKKMSEQTRLLSSGVY